LKNKAKFDVQTVKLEGSNLIEASAGTGKTFSIAILLLRLIIEKSIDIKQILMVTFTKASVAELESRIREFTREAYRYSQNPDYKVDTLIQKIVDAAIKKSNRKIISDRLKGATLNLDETSIFTIHSFCQKTLTEFAFETHQLFGSELLDNQSQIIENATNEYWRKEITTLSVDKIELLQRVGLSKENLTEVITKGLSGKQFVYKKNLEVEKYFDKAFTLKEKEARLYQNFVLEFPESPEKEIENIEKGGHYAKDAFLPIANDAEAFFNKLIEKQSKIYVSKTFPELLQKALDYQDTQIELAQAALDILFYFYGRAIKKVRKYVDKTKQRLE
jgi:exodeoxyribonuclease V beta subunit